MAVVGSMEILGIFKDMGLFLNLKKIQSEMVHAARAVKETSVEMTRAAHSSSLLSKALGLIGVGGFAAFLATMPRVNAELSLAKTWVGLIAHEMDDNLAPAVELVSNGLEKIYNWFSNLSETQQSIISWAMVIGGALLSMGLAAGIAGVAFKGLGLSAIASGFKDLAIWLGRAVAGSVALQVTVGVLVGMLGVLALDKAGVLDWINNLGKNFRDRAAEGDLLTLAVKALLSPVALLGDAIMALLGIKGWDDFKADLRETLDLLNQLKNAMNTKATSVWNAIMPSKYEIHDTGGMAGYTGLHWLKAGETINNSGGGSSPTTITVNNTYGDIVLNNGMDWKEFLEKSSNAQAERLAWRSTR